MSSFEGINRIWDAAAKIDPTSNMATPGTVNMGPRYADGGRTMGNATQKTALDEAFEHWYTEGVKMALQQLGGISHSAQATDVSRAATKNTKHEGFAPPKPLDVPPNPASAWQGQVLQNVVQTNASKYALALNSGPTGNNDTPWPDDKKIQHRFRMPVTQPETNLDPSINRGVSQGFNALSIPGPSDLINAGNEASLGEAGH